MTDRIRKIQESLKKGSDNGDELTAAIAYVPLFGWALVINRQDEFSRFHALQARDLNLAIVLIGFLMWFIENFPLFSWLFGARGLLNPLPEAIWIVASLLYVGLSGYAAYRAIMDEQWAIPYIDDVRLHVKKILRIEK